MKIVKLSTSTFPPPMVDQTYRAFVRELEALSNRLGIAINTVEGIVVFDPDRDQVTYQQNCSGDLEPEISEKTTKTAAAATDQFDFKSFSDELRELSDRYGVKLVSVGALSGVDAGCNGTTYLAIWAGGDAATNGE